MSLLIEKIKYNSPIITVPNFLTQKEFEDNYAIIMNISKLESNINKKLESNGHNNN